MSAMHFHRCRLTLAKHAGDPGYKVDVDVIRAARQCAIFIGSSRRPVRSLCQHAQAIQSARRQL
jgi:hypothetical protein